MSTSSTNLSSWFASWFSAPSIPVNESDDVQSSSVTPSVPQPSFSCSSFTYYVSDFVGESIEQRSGLAWVVGSILVPAQFGPKAREANEVLNQAAENPTHFFQKFTLPVDDSTSLSGVIYYPENWDKNDRSKCLVYHNPNGVTLTQYFDGNSLQWTPGALARITGMPIILYDYRGTGLSSDNVSCSSMSFRPTYESIVVDGEAVLCEMFKQFDNVIVAGSSLGGGVATIALNRHLKNHPEDLLKAGGLINHDSFSTTPRVIMPSWPQLADTAGNLIGALVDAETPMKKLIQRGIPISVLCHEKDPVIGPGSQMAESVEKFRVEGIDGNVSIFYSPEWGHANLSEDMIDYLKGC